MALPATRFEFRIALSHVDRAINREEKVIVARHPSETSQHLILRVLAWCLLWEERLEFGVGLSDPDAPDLSTRDLTGELTTWIECGAASERKLSHVLHHTRAELHFVFDDPKRREALEDPRLHHWQIDTELIRALAANEERRQKWTVTIVGDHFYIDADGKSFDGAITRQVFVPE